jgi:hypothetical protein
MRARLVFGVVLAGFIHATALADQMNADEARRFVANKLFAFNCFDGTRGVGRILEDGSADGSVQFGGGNQLRHIRLPSNTLQVRGQAICASIKGMPFDPCFNLTKSDEASFRGSVSGLGFAYCDFRRQGNVRALMVRSITRSRARRASEGPRSEVQKSETATVSESRVEAVHSEPSLDLRRTKAE